MGRATSSSNGPSRSRPKRVAIGLGLAVLAAIMADRVASWVLVEDGTFGGKRLAPIRTAGLQSRLVESAERLRREGQAGLDRILFDATLGWEPRLDGSDVDAHGARRDGPRVAAQPASGVRRILVFGCSFTFGSEVTGEEAWPAQLDAAREDLEVLNFGVPSYGLDQALLRIERRAPGLAADEVWLCLMPGAVRRPTTHFLPMIRTWSGVPWFKPRMVLDPGGQLIRHANPVASVEETLAAYERPGRFEELLAGRDPWYDAVPSAFERRAAHNLFVGRLYWTWRVFDQASKSPFTTPGGESLVPLHRGIALEAREAARAAGASFRYVVLPAEYDLPPHTGFRSAVITPLVESLVAQEVRVLDATPAVLEVPPDERWAPGGHYSARSNARVGAWLATQLARED